MESGYRIKVATFHIKMTITSTQNDRIKRLRALYKDKKLRDEQNVYIAEGVNLVKDIPAEVRVKELYVKESKRYELSFLESKLHSEVFVVADSIFDAVADSVTPSGVIAVIEKPSNSFDGTQNTALLLDTISDPGNMGTIIRTAAARGITNIVCMDCTDAFSPKCVRAAMGGTFYVSITETEESEAFRLLQSYDVVALDMGGKNIFSYQRTGKVAIAVGSEAHGVRKSVKERAKEILAIPMSGTVESLNAAISAGIAMYVI